MRRLLARTITHPAQVLTALVVISILLGAGLLGEPGQRGLRVDASVQPLLPTEDEALDIFQASQQLFGREDVVIVALRTGQALAPASLELLKTLHLALDALPGVSEVTSLYNAPLVRDIDGVTEIRPVPVWLQREPQAAPAVLALLRQHAMYRRTLISDDAAVAGLFLALDAEQAPRSLRGGVADQILLTADRVLATEAVAGAQVWVGGPSVVTAATVTAISRSYKKLLPAIVIVFVLLLAYAFRSKRGVLLPMLVIGISLLWTLGLMAWLGRELNLVTVIVPPLIMTLGLAYSLHFFSTYYALALRFQRRPRLLVGLSLRRMAFPLLLTGLTTVCGFLALRVSPLPAIREFGALAALGVVITVLVSLTLIPAALSLIRPPQRIRQPAAMTWLFALLSRLLMRYRISMLVVGAIVAVLSLLSASQIRVGSNFVTDFAPETRVRSDHEAISQALGGANVFNILIRAELNDAFLQPDVLTALQNLQQWLQAQPEIGVTVSLINALEEIDQTLGGVPGQFEIPEQASTVKQMLVVGGGRELATVVDTRFRNSNILVRAEANDSFALGALVNRIADRLAQLPAPLRGHVTGETVLVAHTLNRIGEGQILTLGAAILAIYIVLAIVFLSLRGALLALLPNLLPLLVYYGALGLSGVPLSPTTSLISCIVLGIAVDDTIHYLTRFNTLARRQGDETAATAIALQDVLRPVTLTSIALVLGFLMMTASELRNQVHFGALAAFTMAMAWLSDVSFTPALAAQMRVVSLWDLLRLDLGRNPQEAIPLFRGLNLLQARTFALLAQQRVYKAGVTLWRQGDAGDDMYVVIHGELAVWLEAPEGRRRLATMRRGDVLGEGGFFLQARTATISVTEPVKLLQFTARDLDRITRRRPLLGARILRNLNYIQAERVARLSRQVAGQADD